MTNFFGKALWYHMYHCLPCFSVTHWKNDVRSQHSSPIVQKNIKNDSIIWKVVQSVGVVRITPSYFLLHEKIFSQILLGFKEEIYSSKTGEADVIPLQTKIKSLILLIIYCIQTPILQGRAERAFSKISVYRDRILFRFGLH